MQWFQKRDLNKHVILIRENFSEIDPRFYTKYTNMYLIKGNKKAILLDTGIGVESIKKFVEPLVKNLELLVFNSHHHFDHVAGNYEFNSVYAHKFDLKFISKTRDISFLEGIKTKTAEFYRKRDFKIKTAETYYPVEEGENFDLGGINIKIIHTPGHTKGSISLLTNKGHLFTADTIHEGAVYLPPKENIEDYIDTLDKIQTILDKQEKETLIFPGHEKPIITKKHVSRIREDFSTILKEKDLTSYRYDEFLEARIIKKPPFLYVIPVEKDETYSI